MTNPLNKDALRNALLTYFGGRYQRDCARVLGISPRTVEDWVHRAKPIRPLYYRRIIAHTPQAHKRVEDWGQKRLAAIRAWIDRKHVAIDEAERLLAWAAESAERNSRKPKENSSI